MREIGGYIELDTYSLPMLHEDAIALNSGRNCLAYLFRSRGIKKIKIPFFICNAIYSVCEREGVKKTFYHIDKCFRPKDLNLDDDEWLYLVNFYGQLSNEEIKSYVDKYNRVIVDQANDYFATPIPGVDTFYTCRKWFGVTDGAFLYTSLILNDDFPTDVSFDRMRFILGRYEKTANEFYSEYNNNNKFFKNEPIKAMSKLTQNLLHAIDYSEVKEKRKRNFEYIHSLLRQLNELDIQPTMFMYPFMIKNGDVLRKKLQEEKIYIPTLWPTVFDVTTPTDLEYIMAKNILPLPIDQRYSISEMSYMVDKIIDLLNL